MRVQHDLEERYVYRPPSGRVYLFSGLITCAECGRHFKCHRKDDRVYYRCFTGYYNRKDCENATSIKEKSLEESVLNALYELVKGKRQVYKTEEKSRSAQSKAAIKGKLERLSNLYIDGDISKEQYQKRRAELTAKLNEPEERGQPKAIEVCGDNFLDDYAALSREQKRVFLRSVIERIEVNKAGDIDIFFSV